MNPEFDVVIVGGGPGGYVAAIRAGQLGLKTALVEKDASPGGTCLHWGCIPTKALLHTAEVLQTAREAARFGVLTGDVRLDLEAAHRHKNAAVQRNAKGVEFLLKRNGVELVRGFGRLAGGGAVEVAAAGGARTLRARAIVLATGSEVRGLPGIEFNGTSVIGSDEALNLKRVPASLIVLGAGAVGVEFASIWSRFGAQVTLVELLERVVPLEDADIGAELERALRKRKIAVHTATRLDQVTQAAEGVRVTARQGDKDLSWTAEVLLVAVGRKPRTEGIGLEEAGVALEKGFVKVDALMRTSVPGVYAIGDIVPTPQLAHVASHEGLLAIDVIAGRPAHPIHYDQTPACTYCDPEIASVGLTEAEARRRGHAVKIGRFPFSALGKAGVMGVQEGFVKLVGEARHDELLGVHMIGPRVTELIGEICAALRLESTVEELFHAVHPHPTLSEIVQEAALAAHGRPLHMVLETPRPPAPRAPVAGAGGAGE